MIKIISFDFDGTLATHQFADAFWLKGVPALYATRHHTTLKDAQTILFKEYDTIGENRIEWYDPGYWFDRFDLQADWKKELKTFEPQAEVYPEVPTILAKLSQHYKLIISSNAKREFIDVQLTHTRLTPYFHHIFSSTSDFHTIKKVTDFYAMICDKLKLKPNELIHVGDHKDFDYAEPKKHGITAYYLDRKHTTEGPHVVHSLTEFAEKIQHNK